VRFEVIGEAWQLFQQQMGTWIVASLIAAIVLACVVVPFYIVVFAASFAAARAGHAQPFDVSIGILPRITFQLVYSGVFSFLLGGMFRMATKQIRGEAISAGDIFSVVDVVGPLIGAVILVNIVQTIGMFLCCLPWLIFGGLLMFTIPLVVDRRMGPTDAMGASWNALRGEWLMATLFYVVIYILGHVGWIACCVGILFTFPFIPLGISLLYRDFFMDAGGPAPYVPPPPVPETPAAYTPPAAEAPPPPPAPDAAPPTVASAEGSVETMPPAPAAEPAPPPPESPPAPPSSPTDP
jgi:uncharacterized membrane protein